MTVTVKPGRLAIVIAVALGVVVAYLIGSSRTAGAVAAPTQTTGLSSLSGVPTVSTATGSGSTPGITVSGTGTVSGTPDTLVISLSVTANGSTVSSAFSSANGAMAAVQRTLRGKGVAAADMQTSNVSVEQRYDNRGNANGYTVNEGLTVTVHDIGRASDDMAAAVAAGRNLVRIDGVSLDLKDTGPLVSRARDAAFAEAKTKATQYAHAAGRGLGAVVSIEEVTQAPQPIYYGAFAARAVMATPMAPPIQAGSQQVAVQVTVTFAMS
jgi:uncharacterized protein